MMAPAWRSKWLDWQPEDEILSVSSESELTNLTKAEPEPTEAHSVSFVSARSVPYQIISSAPEPDDFDPLDPLREPFVRWFNSRVCLDVPALSGRAAPRWHTGVDPLHRNCCDWMLEQDHQVIPPTRPEFRQLLRELGCRPVVICDQEYVANVALCEDEEAVRQTASADGGILTK